MTWQSLYKAEARKRNPEIRYRDRIHGAENLLRRCGYEVTAPDIPLPEIIAELMTGTPKEGCGNG